VLLLVVLKVETDVSDTDDSETVDSETDVSDWVVGEVWLVEEDSEFVGDE